MLAPIIVWPMQESLFKDKVVDARLARLLKVGRRDLEERATNFEVALYCSSFFMCYPPARDVCDVYMYALRHSEIRDFGQCMDHEPMLKDQGLSLSLTAQELYDSLSRWIYRKQEEGLKEERKVVRALAKKHAATSKTTQDSTPAPT